MKSRITVVFVTISFIISSLLVFASCSRDGGAEDLGEPEIVLYSSLRMGDGPIAMTLYDLEFWGTHIVRAEVLGSRVECHCGQTCTHYDPWQCVRSLGTFYQIRVLESFKGDKEAGSKIEFRMWGGRLGIMEFINDRADQNKIPLSIGDEFIFFLSSLREEPMLLVSPNVAVPTLYRIPPHLTTELSNGITNAFLNNPSLAYEVLEDYSLYTTNRTLNLTIGDLMRISGILERETEEE
jgi:hypothetical protein